MTFPRTVVSTLLASRHFDWDRVLRIAEVGSTAHGISISGPGGDDHDFTVVRIESFEELVTGSSKKQSVMLRTAKEGEKSQPYDVDLNVYTLRRFAQLALKGNPSILAAIFSPKQHVDFMTVDFELLAKLVESKMAGKAFLGYMQQQIDRWIGIRGQKSVTRPDLVEAYGFDTKYAAHVIRLGVQGREYLDTRRFAMPMEEHMAKIIRDVRTGEFDEREALVLARNAETELLRAYKESELPERPNDGAVREWLYQQYVELVARPRS